MINFQRKPEARGYGELFREHHDPFVDLPALETAPLEEGGGKGHIRMGRGTEVAVEKAPPASDVIDWNPPPTIEVRELIALSI